MKKLFVQTSNVTRFMGALKALRNRGAEECSMLVIDGIPGLGKTTALEWWVTSTNSVYLRAKKEWTPSWFLDDLLDAFRVSGGSRFHKERYKRALQELVDRRLRAEMTGQPFALVIDEADHISRNAKVIESIRDLTDPGEITLVLVGMGKIRDNLTAFPQISSRVAQYCRFERATFADVRLLADKLCEVKVADCLAGFIEKATGGLNREIKEALATVERFAKLNAPGADGVTLKQMAGQALINDRKTGQVIMVPGTVPKDAVRLVHEGEAA